MAEPTVKRSGNAAKLQVDKRFTYKGTDRRGQVVKGDISAQSLTAAKLQLKKQGLVKATVKPKAKELSIPFLEKGIGSDDVTLFLRQMATMMKAGVPLVQAFDLVADGLTNKKMQQVIQTMRNDVASGGTFASALRAHPRYFDDLVCNLVHSGEQAGALETMLDRVALYKEKSESLKRRIKSAMKYPIIVLLVAGVVTTILMVKVIPVFSELFEGFGAALPAPTQIAVNMSDWMVAHWWKALIVLVATIFFFREATLRSRKFRHVLQRITLRLPVFGSLLHMAAVARYARTLSTTFAAGVPLVEALDSAGRASGNIVYETSILAVRDEVSGGTELNVSMRHQSMFPPMLVQMVAIGENSGALDDMLGRAAVIYEEEVDTKVDGLTSMMEPLIMSFLGIVVGGLVVSMYLPIFQMGNVVG